MGERVVAVGGGGGIRVLGAHVVNQIAAGEVVERPASVVKELVDNALDAGATRVVVELESGGVELVRVTDDGGGIGAGELALAVRAHATSKITGPEDLERVGTLGFRGEALASIGSVSRLSMRSRARGSDVGSVIEVDGGEVGGVRPASGPVGTSVSVRTLFFNTPARRKFLRSAGTEQGHCVEVVRTLALAFPGVGFECRCDGREVLSAPAGQSPRERCLEVLGRELEGDYGEAHADEFDDTRGLALWGLVGKPHLARGTTKGQHLFVNGRPVKDRTMQHAVREAYRGLIEPGRHPSVVVMVEMDPRAVDVNVHPAKAEVRFRDPNLVHRVVYRAVREALGGVDATPEPAGSGVRFEGGGEGGGGSEVASFIERFERMEVKDAGGFDFEGLKRAVEADRERMERERAALEAERAQREEGGLGAGRRASRLLQVHDSYLVTQDEDGVVIIDQHALHERVMFERLKERVESGALESQRLLVPEVVEATSGQVGMLEELGGLFARLGIEADAMGPESVAVRAFPTLLFDRGVGAGEFVGELLGKVESGGMRAGDGSEAALHEVLDMMACKAAVKAGEHLSEEELGELLAMRERVERASNCPHGRPTTIRLTLRELERQFGRR